MDKTLEQKLRQIIKEQLSLLEEDFIPAFSKKEENAFIRIIEKYSGIIPVHYMVDENVLCLKFNNLADYKKSENVIKKLAYKTNMGYKLDLEDIGNDVEEDTLEPILYIYKQ